MSILKKGLCTVALVSIITGCANQSQKPVESPTYSESRIINISGMHAGSMGNRIRPVIQANSRTQQIQKTETDNAWDLTRQNLLLELDIQDKRIDRELLWLENNPRHVMAVSQRALPYYHYILEQVLARGMPAEVALIPFIESGYNPFAVSPASAAGPWQFMPRTAQSFGLESNSWYDGRRDIIASTDAALNYLSVLNDMFEGDWLLTFAAYNAGEGNVKRAINRNLESNHPTDYWSLQLPGETMRYVPKILATALAIRDATQLGLELEEIPAESYFVEVNTHGQLDLSHAAQLADIDIDELKRLNPGFHRGVTAPNGPHRLLLPVDQASQFKSALVNLPAKQRSNLQRSNLQRYTIKAGDTLGALAQRFGTTVVSIKSANQLNSTQLRIGQKLIIPNDVDSTDVALKSSRAESG